MWSCEGVDVWLQLKEWEYMWVHGFILYAHWLVTKATNVLFILQCWSFCKDWCSGHIWIREF